MSDALLDRGKLGYCKDTLVDVTLAGATLFDGFKFGYSVTFTSEDGMNDVVLFNELGLGCDGIADGDVVTVNEEVGGRSLLSGYEYIGKVVLRCVLLVDCDNDGTADGGKVSEELNMFDGGEVRGPASTVLGV